MKKTLVLLLALGLAATLAACGRRKNENTTPNTTMPTRATTAPTTEVTILPTLETNIPDPDVNSTMPDMTDGIGNTDATHSTGAARSMR